MPSSFMIWSAREKVADTAPFFFHFLPVQVRRTHWREALAVRLRSLRGKFQACNKWVAPLSGRQPVINAETDSYLRLEDRQAAFAWPA